MSKKTLSRALASIGLAAAALSCTPAFSSHHFELALVRKTTALNQLDNFVFQSSRPGYTVFIMSVNSVPKAGAEGLFAADALYNIHVASDAAFKTGHTFSLAFDKAGGFSLYESNEPNGAVGATGAKLGEGKLGKTTEAGEGIKVWAGTAKDPFYGNSPGLGIFRAQINAGSYDPKLWSSVKGANIFSGRLSSVIVLEVPNSQLGTDIKVFMTTAVKQGEQWEQVQYSANPLFSHTMLFESETLKALHDHDRPGKDDEMKHYVAARTARASALAKTQADPIGYGDKVAQMLVPDVLNYKVGSKAEFSNAQRNGRALDDDAMSTMLTLLIGALTDQAITNPKQHTAEFPYVMPDVLK